MAELDYGKVIEDHKSYEMHRDAIYERERAAMERLQGIDARQPFSEAEGDQIIDDLVSVVMARMMDRYQERAVQSRSRELEGDIPTGADYAGAFLDTEDGSARNAAYEKTFDELKDGVSPELYPGDVGDIHYQHQLTRAIDQDREEFITWMSDYADDPFKRLITAYEAPERLREHLGDRLTELIANDYEGIGDALGSADAINAQAEAFSEIMLEDDGVKDILGEMDRFVDRQFPV